LSRLLPNLGAESVGRCSVGSISTLHHGMLFRFLVREVHPGALHVREQLRTDCADGCKLLDANDYVPPWGAVPEAPPEGTQTFDPGTAELAGQDPAFAVARAKVRETKPRYSSNVP
jgi:hypothetical protein